MNKNTEARTQIQEIWQQLFYNFLSRVRNPQFIYKYLSTLWFML